MHDEKPQRVEKSVDEKSAEHTESRSVGKQRDQASNEIIDGTLNEQKKSEKTEIQRTGKSKITGVKGAEGGPGFPSAESIFGNVSEQTSLRSDWQQDNSRKSALIKEIRDANAKGMLIGDGGFVEQPKPLDVRQESPDNLIATVRPSFADIIYGRNHLPRPARPDHAANDPPGNPGEKPDDSDKSGGDKIPAGSIVGGGAPPPGDDDETRRRLSDPYFDPDHGTVWEFVRKHTHLPKQPDKVTEHEKKKDADEDRKKDEEITDVVKSGYTSEIYKNSNGELISAATMSDQIGLGRRTDLLRKLTDDEIRQLGYERIANEKVDALISGKLDKIIESTVKIENGKVTEETGLAASDQIRETLRPFCKDIDKRNIAFKVSDIDGHRQIRVALNRGEAVPGTMPTVRPQALEPDMNPAFPRNSDSEFKLLEPDAQEFKDHGYGHIALFTEQQPCLDSCKPIIEDQLPFIFTNRISISVTSVYPSETARTEAVKKRVEKQKNAK